MLSFAAYNFIDLKHHYFCLPFPVLIDPKYKRDTSSVLKIVFYSCVFSWTFLAGNYLKIFLFPDGFPPKRPLYLHWKKKAGVSGFCAVKLSLKSQPLCLRGFCVMAGLLAKELLLTWGAREDLMVIFGKQENNEK